jgi:hypothetical protein
MSEPQELVYALRLETLTRIHRQLTWATKAVEFLKGVGTLESTMLVGEWEALVEGKAPPSSAGESIN